MPILLSFLWLHTIIFYCEINHKSCDFELIRSHLLENYDSAFNCWPFCCQDIIEVFWLKTMHFWCVMILWFCEGKIPLSQHFWLGKIRKLWSDLYSKEKIGAKQNVLFLISTSFLKKTQFLVLTIESCLPKKWHCHVKIEVSNWSY